MLGTVGALTASSQGAAINPYANTGDTVLGPIDQGGPVVTFNAGTGAGGSGMWIAAAIGVAALAWFLTRKK